MTGDDGGGRQLEAVRKTLDIVEALWDADGAGVTELTELTGLPKSTVHAHLSTLRAKGYVVRTDSAYELSLRFLAFGEHVKHSEPLYGAAEIPVEDLAEQTGERVLCATYQNGLGTTLCVGEGRRSASSDIDVGTHFYLHASALGKAILAHLPDDEVEAVVDEWGLPAFTDTTITDRDALFEELQTVREEGVSYNHGEHVPGVYAVAAPVMDADEDEVHGAVSVLGPARRLESEWESEELRDRLLATANTIEVNLMFA